MYTDVMLRNVLMWLTESFLYFIESFIYIRVKENRSVD